MSLIVVLKQDDNSDQGISDEKCERPRESTVLSVIEEEDSDHQLEVLHLH